MDKSLFDFIFLKNIESINIENEDYFVNQRSFEKVPSIDRNTARLLFFISYLIKPEYILEIGFGSGFSSYSLYSGSKESIKKIFSFEHEKKRYLKGLDFIETKKLPVELINKDFSKEALNEIFEKKLKSDKNANFFDVIFIDGTKREYPFYFEIAFDYLRKGGIILFDNVLFNGNILKLIELDKGKNVEGAKILINFVYNTIKDNRLLSYLLPVGDGILISIKK